MAVFNGVAPVIGSLISAKILNTLAEVYSGVELAFGVISVLLIYQFLYTFLESAVSMAYSTLITVSGELVAKHVKMKIMNKAKTIDIVSYDEPDFYSRMENANREAGMRPLQIMSSSFLMFSNIVSIISFVAILFAVSAVAPLLIALVSIPQAIISMRFSKKNVDYMFRSSKKRRQMEYYASTIVNKDLAKEIRVLNLGDTFCEKYDEAFEEYYKGLKKLQIHACLWNLAARILMNAVYCLIYIYLAKGVFEGLYAVGDFSLYTGAISTIGNGIGQIIIISSSIYEGTLFINNLISFLNEKPKVVPSVLNPRHVERNRGHRIVFENVSFSYPGNDREVIKNMSFVIEPGEAIVIVGLNGAGKTTLIKLLTRLYDPSSGKILLDGRDIREYDVKELYAIFGIVFQDFGKYAVTAAENIEFGDISAIRERDDIIAAAEQSGANIFIDKLPKKYDTPLMRFFEEEGIELSIGQWQKLSIARAFYSQSDILILDEPTASLDPIAEQEIFNKFNILRKGKTSIFISHRLSSATLADKILVIEDGELIESGSHLELMKKGGRYRELFTTQAERYIQKI